MKLALSDNLYELLFIKIFVENDFVIIPPGYYFDFISYLKNVIVFSDNGTMVGFV